MTLDLEAIRKRAEAANMQSVRDAVEAFGKAARKFGASLEKGGDQFIATFDAELVGAKAALLAEIARLKGERDEAPSWRCFHCDEVFATVESAREHFGSDCLCTPGCCIDITEYRRMEAAHQSHLDETDAGSRHYFALQALHREALKREEEKGYARGIDDMRAELATAESALAACREENERLREGLKPFADDADNWTAKAPDSYQIKVVLAVSVVLAKFTVGDLRRARTLVEGGGA